MQTITESSVFGQSHRRQADSIPMEAILEFASPYLRDDPSPGRPFWSPDIQRLVRDMLRID